MENSFLKEFLADSDLYGCSVRKKKQEWLGEPFLVIYGTEFSEFFRLFPEIHKFTDGGIFLEIHAFA